MSATIFQGQPGSVIALNDPTMQGITPMASISPGITFQSQKSLITRVTISQQTNHQFMHTLGGDIYLYVFGDRIGQMTISGICAAANCDNLGDSQYGFEKMLAYYATNKLSALQTPVTAMIGQTAITGFIAGLTGSVFDYRLLLMQYDLSLMTLSIAAQLSSSSSNPLAGAFGEFGISV